MCSVLFFSGLVSDNIQKWYDFISETQLYIMANCDLVFDYPKPLFPNVVSVEGLSVSEVKPLSKGNMHLHFCGPLFPIWIIKCMHRPIHLMSIKTNHWTYVINSLGRKNRNICCSLNVFFPRESVCSCHFKELTTWRKKNKTPDEFRDFFTNKRKFKKHIIL